VDNEILEQIHTFNLKRGSVNSQNPRDSDSGSVNFSNRRASSTSAHRAFYVSEFVKIQDAEMERTMNVLKEIIKQIDEFNNVKLMKTERRIEYLQQRLGEKKRLKISFSDEEEIERLKIDNQYKLNVRSALGIKNSDDWIFNLNIGNVMHMSPIGFDDLHSSLNLEALERR
jgi:hypothetical protein